MIAQIIYIAPMTDEGYLEKAEQKLGQFNEVFREIYEGCKAEVGRLKIEIYALGYGLRQDHTGWRLAI